MWTIESTYVKSGPNLRLSECRGTCGGVRASLAGPPWLSRIGRRAAPIALLWALAGCSWIAPRLPGWASPYRPDVQQGNVITREMVEQLREGMTRDQVKFMLGTPLLADAFHPDRWDYLYYLKPRAGKAQQRSLVVYFKDNRLDRFTSDPMPPESMADNLILKVKIKPSPQPKEPAPQATSPEPTK